ncbi:hypothetical protein [Shewanella xiamenensis]|uniref:hypothetical protein n=1 Tax=Shewanella xiamenensis TaxID=332186 RepID=UPI0024A76EF8|nr:hypothetical protein [Shewanella xiamenensis]MDI5837386.1 hypothetical protein [Shewanella xiamenensis]MDI5840361.1 hypothetical protein [Shewanella xiamenensis]MDI5844406.1 hypothetical protein [Shewanella xiamenensis]MDI5848004.1 hypothetical protein [Shewanella xiamenensis]MDI5852296.1 hypothetical protein [Shewanella xiamenensis]
MENKQQACDNLERYIAQTKAVINGIAAHLQGYGNAILAEHISPLRSQIDLMQSTMPALFNILENEDGTSQGEVDQSELKQAQAKSAFGLALPLAWGLLDMLMVMIERLNIDLLSDLVWLARDRVEDIKREYELITAEKVYWLSE